MGIDGLEHGPATNEAVANAGRPAGSSVVPGLDHGWTEVTVLENGIDVTFGLAIASYRYAWLAPVRKQEACEAHHYVTYDA